jgi:putative ABC transport system permease protein
MQLLGVDPFAEAPFRNYLWAEGGADLGQLVAFLTQPGAILLSTGLAESYGLQAGSEVVLQVGGFERQAFVAGLMRPADSLSRRALQGLILTDLATAQELTGRLGRLDRIDLVLRDDGGTSVQQLGSLLPEGARIEATAARAGSIAEMTSAFRVNLTALSMLALVVGMLLIYNTVTFSVVQRRTLFGTLRSLGATPREVFAQVVLEALLIGSVGSGLGLLLGIVLGLGAVRLVSQTINDVYYVLTVRTMHIPAISLLKGGLLGIAATAFSAAPPAWEAASVPPRVSLSRSGLEDKAVVATRRAAWAGVGLAGLGTLLLALPTRSLLVSFAGTACAVLVFAVLTPLVTRFLMRALGPALGRIWGVLGRMAPRDVVTSLSRTAVALAALMVAVSVTIGVSLMVGSFRYTVSAWMDQALQGDIYIQTPSLQATQAPTAPLHPEVLAIVRRRPEVRRVDTLRSMTVDSPEGPLSMFAVDNPRFPERPFLVAEGSPEEIWQAMQDGAVTVSEALARRLGLSVRGGSITLFTDRGAREFSIAGVYYDYISSVGTVAMSDATYRRFWDDDTLTALALRLAPEADVDSVARELQETFDPSLGLLSVRANRALRDEVLRVFDRTFAITSALQLLATTVAFIGVLSALLSVQLERQRDLAILRAVGLTGRQLRRLIMLQTGLMGSVAGLLAMPTGFVLALILIYIINRRAFGWTLLLQIEVLPFVLALVVAVLAALLAGAYPARRVSRSVVAEALLFE